MSSAETTDSPQVQLIRAFCEAFRKRDMSLVAKCLHKDHRRITHPRSVGKPEQTKEEYLQHTAEVMSLWVNSEAGYDSFKHPTTQLNDPHSLLSIRSSKPPGGRSSLMFVRKVFGSSEC